jgi:hypothetical protein
VVRIGSEVIGVKPAGFAFERNDFVAEGETIGLLRDWTGVWVLPIEFLYGKLRRGLARLNRLTFEDRVAGQNGLFSLGVDSIESKTHTAVGTFSIAPCDRDHVIIGKGHCVTHLCFSLLEIKKRGRASTKGTRPAPKLVTDIPATT